MNYIDILSKRISLSHIEVIHIKGKKYTTRKEHKYIKRRPLSISYLTIGQLAYILAELARNHNQTIHYFAFNKQKFLVTIIEEETEVERSVEYCGQPDAGADTPTPNQNQLAEVHSNPPQ